MKNTKMWIAAVAMAATTGVASARCVPHVGPSTTDSAVLVVTATSLVLSEDGGRRTLTTLGTITNPSQDCFQNVRLELQYFDEAKRHVDTATESLEELVVPAGETVQFRVREPAGSPVAAYVTQSVRVVDADVRWIKPDQSHGVLVDLLLSWAPMLLLIGVWIFFIRRSQGRGSPQVRLIAQAEQQIGIAREQCQALQRIAAALERRSGLDTQA